MTRPNRVSLFMFLMCFPGAAFAQEGSASFPSIDASSIFIANKGNIEVSYSVRPQDGDWSVYKIAPGSNDKISCNDCSASTFEISINTEDRNVTYSLASGDRYYIGWNSEKNVWDVYRASE